ncbi:B-cell lymphoma 3 protein [Tachyglossus aculeatus]|uniref:B-cell lymphoma 3 protein n=1 Tax=Tachyglossus aculeatus TaxID=9261 RepID=UPI0018F5DE39|nr:B-cell lymphoma 3 protein [Tachyglossus aculeatus]
MTLEEPPPAGEMEEEGPVDLRTRGKAATATNQAQRRAPPEASLPLRKRPYRNPETPAPAAEKAPRMEGGSAASGLATEGAIWTPSPGLSMARPPALYLPGSFPAPALPFYPPALTGSLSLLGFPPPPFSLICPLEYPLASDIAMATRADEDGDTPLHIAVVQGNLPAVQRLVDLFLQGRRDLDVYNHLRQTPLHLAVITTLPSVVRLLLSRGASPMALDRHGQTAAHLACEHRSPSCLRALLEGAAPGAVGLEARNYEGLTPLHVAVNTEDPETVLYLLERGADIDAVDIKSGRSPLIHAVENNSLSMVTLLLQHGANVNAQMYSGSSALHSASGRGLLPLVRTLVRSGADSGLKNCHNDTPLMVARNRRVIDILRGKAARPAPPGPPEGLSPEQSCPHSPESGSRLSPNGPLSTSPSSSPPRSPLGPPDGPPGSYHLYLPRSPSPLSLLPFPGVRYPPLPSPAQDGS